MWVNELCSEAKLVAVPYGFIKCLRDPSRRRSGRSIRDAPRPPDPQVESPARDAGLLKPGWSVVDRSATSGVTLARDRVGPPAPLPHRQHVGLFGPPPSPSRRCRNPRFPREARYARSPAHWGKASPPSTRSVKELSTKSRPVATSCNCLSFLGDRLQRA